MRPHLNYTKIVNEDDHTKFTKADWITMYEQITALRRYWWKRLMLPPRERETVDSEWRQSL